MLALISPAKKLDYETEWSDDRVTQPVLLDHAAKLAAQLKDVSQADIQELMHLSDKLGALNYDRYQDYTTPFTKDNARPAIKAFQGDTYVGLDAKTLSDDDTLYAQSHLGILSGLYGILRPLDLMQAYRLEMGTRFANARGKNLYEFWGSVITQACNAMLEEHKDKTVISLASNEYIKAIKADELPGAFITCHFKEVKNGTPKVVGLFAKRARGMMARYMMQKRIESPEGLKAFSEDRYEFAPELSTKTDYVFIRKAL